MRQDDFTAAIDQYYEELVQRLTLVLHDREEARDVAQDAYLRAFKAWGRFDGANPRAWLHTIGLRVAFNTLRRRRLSVRIFQSRAEPAETWLLPDRMPLWESLGKLSPPQRAALLLNVLDGYTQAEIARILGAPSGTVASWLASAKARMRNELREE